MSAVCDGVDDGRLGQHVKTYNRILDLLSCRRIRQAVSVARCAGMHRLCLLLSQIGGDDNAKTLLHRQVLQWEESGAVQFVPPELIAIYKVLAGDAVLHDSADQCVLREMSWTRALAMLFWYAGASHGLLSEAINKFNDAWSMGMLAMPTAPSRTPSSDKECEHNALYRLLTLLLTDTRDEAELAFLTTRSLYNGGFTGDLLDTRGSYVTLVLLECLGIVNASSAAASIVRNSTIFQLLSVGMWQWAVFVTLQIPNESQRNALVRDILDRWAGFEGWEMDTCCRENIVVSRLQIPIQWVHEATARRCGYNGKLTQSIAYLNLAGLWEEAAVAVYSEVAPRAMFSSSSATDKLK